jgi:hypothetical protein
MCPETFVNYCNIREPPQGQEINQRVSQHYKCELIVVVVVVNMKIA